MKEKENKYCQSCGMPLDYKGKKYNGTEADGSPSKTYCEFCYKDGAFTHPDITALEMWKIGEESIKQSEDIGWFTKKMISLFYTKRTVKKLDRWKTKK